MKLTNRTKFLQVFSGHLNLKIEQSGIERSNDCAIWVWDKTFFYENHFHWRRLA